MQFFVGLKNPNHAKQFARAFISITTIRDRKSDFGANDWILDSGAFSIIQRHRGYPESESVAVYAAQIRRWRTSGNLLAAVAQDYMCGPDALALTGLSVAEHQRLTIERYDALVAERTGVYILPVLQGWRPRDYAAHIRQYGRRLKHNAWVGVGSIVKRNVEPRAIRGVLDAIRAERPDLRLHGFGIKVTSLAVRDIQDALFTADSMSWSFQARMSWMKRDRGKGGIAHGVHELRFAKAFVQRIEEMCVPLSTGSSEWLTTVPQRTSIARRLSDL